MRVTQGEPVEVGMGSSKRRCVGNDEEFRFYSRCSGKLLKFIGKLLKEWNDLIEVKNKIPFTLLGSAMGKKENQEFYHKSQERKVFVKQGAQLLQPRTKNHPLDLVTELLSGLSWANSTEWWAQKTDWNTLEREWILFYIPSTPPPNTHTHSARKWEVEN